MTPMDAFFELQPLLLDKLKAAVAGMSPKVHVLTADDLAGVVENQQFTPAVHLVYQRYKVLETRSDGTSARLAQDWLCIVTTRSQKAIRAGDAARENAGQLACKVCGVLMGYKPLAMCKPTQIANAPDAGYSAGFQYLPLAFTTEIIFQPSKETL